MAERPDYRAVIRQMHVGPRSKLATERDGPPTLVVGFKPEQGAATVQSADVIDFVNRRLAAHPDERALITVMKPGAGGPGGLRSVRAGQLRRIYNRADFYAGLDLHGDDDDTVDHLNWARIVFYRDNGQRAGAGRGGARAPADCLFKCIQRHCNGEVPYGISCDKVLRERLEVDPTGPISIDGLFPKLERLFPCKKFICESDVGFAYDSSRRSKEVVRIKLTAGHFTLVKAAQEILATEPKPIRVYQRVADGVRVWDTPVDSVLMSHDEFAEHSTGYLTQPFWLHAIKRDSKLGRDKTPAEVFSEWDSDRAALLQCTGGALDIAKYGSIKRAALAAWLNNAQAFANADIEPVGPIEQRWVSDAMRGSLIYGKRDYSGPAIGLDMNSCYPAVLASKQTIPLAPGREVVLEAIAEFPTVGFYRCTITDAPRQLFRSGCGPTVFTHNDIRAARRLGAQIALVNDGCPNAYVYDVDTSTNGRTQFYKLFGRFVDEFYAYKLSGVSAAKKLLNTLTGALGERSYRTVRVTGPVNIDGEIVCETNHQSTDMDADYDVQFVPDDAPLFVRGRWARIYPFIVGRGRELMAETFAGCVDRVIRIHTDGVYLSGSDVPAHVKMGAGLGEWKVEHEPGVYYVHNAMRVTKVD